MLPCAFIITQVRGHIYIAPLHTPPNVSSEIPHGENCITNQYTTVSEWRA